MQQPSQPPSKSPSPPVASPPQPPVLLQQVAGPDVHVMSMSSSSDAPVAVVPPPAHQTILGERGGAGGAAPLTSTSTSSATTSSGSSSSSVRSSQHAHAVLCMPPPPSSLPPPPPIHLLRHEVRHEYSQRHEQNASASSSSSSSTAPGNKELVADPRRPGAAGLAESSEMEEDKAAARAPLGDRDVGLGPPFAERTFSVPESELSGAAAGGGAGAGASAKPGELRWEDKHNYDSSSTSGRFARTTTTRAKRLPDVAALDFSFRTRPREGDGMQRHPYRPRNPYVHKASISSPTSTTTSVPATSGATSSSSSSSSTTTSSNSAAATAKQPTYPTKPFLSPHHAAANFENRYDLDTLFFVFYYQTGSYSQYLASQELSKLAWRFHRQYLTWFQRQSEPKIICTNEYERGSYVYFDHDTAWRQRIKADFTFDYRYLEEGLAPGAAAAAHAAGGGGGGHPAAQYGFHSDGAGVQPYPQPAVGGATAAAGFQPPQQHGAKNACQEAQRGVMPSMPAPSSTAAVSGSSASAARERGVGAQQDAAPPAGPAGAQPTQDGDAQEASTKCQTIEICAERR